MMSELPDYAALTPEALSKACQAAVDAADACVDAIVGVPDGERTYANTLLALEEAEQLAQAGSWTVLAHVAVDDALRDAGREWEARLRKYEVALRFHEGLHGAVAAFAATPQAAELTGEDARLLEHTLRDYRRNGFDLPAAERARLRALFDELVELESKFDSAISEWQDGIEVTRDDLAGLPDAYVDGLERDGERYRVSLDYPQYLPFMANARSSDQRRELMERNQRKGGAENVAVVERAIEVRGEIARTLGYDSWAAYVVEPQMAGRRENVDAFLDDLRRRVAVKADRDLAEYAEALQQTTGTREVHVWDQAFALEQLKRTRFAVDDMAVAEYFPLDACLDGLFGVMGDVLGLRFTEVADTSVWHPSVRVFDIAEARPDAGDAGEPFARFLMDLHPRANKFKHAAAFPLVTGRRLADGSYRQPVAAIVANFTEPGAGRPALLRHSEVVTLFHEFGHVLHETLTRAERTRFAGTMTERDFVEAPSQMLEHWCWDADVLRRFARHHETGEPLPQELLDGLIAAKHAGSGLATLRQIFLASVDFAYHSPGFGGDSTAELRRVHERVGFPYLEGTHFQSGFGHLFGYDAGYYGYLWSRSLGDDMFTVFESAGPMDAATGARYRRTVLARGGSVDGARMVREFLGREPDNAAFLRDLGLTD